MSKPTCRSCPIKANVATAGELLADGGMLELVSSSAARRKPDLLLWFPGKVKFGPRVEHSGCVYEAAELPPSLFRAIRLPARCAKYGSASLLFAGVTDFFKHHSNCPDRESGLLAAFSIATWFPDRLPTAPCLTIAAPDQESGINLLRLLSCVCRHPLLLAEFTPAGLRSLPVEFSLTLLLNQAEPRPNLQRVLRASGYRGMHLPGNRGTVVDLYGPKVLLCEDNAAVERLGAGVIRISVTPAPSPSPPLTDDLQNEFANYFQPRLLMYRLKNYSIVHDAQVDVSNLTFSTRQLARTLASCFPKDPQLALNIVQLLRPQDDAILAQRSRDVKFVILEILWSMIHARKQQEVRIDELASNVNALLRSRGEVLAYSPEEIGWRLNGLNLVRRNSSAGRHILLGRDTSEAVHRLVRSYDVPRPQPVEAGCVDCSDAETLISK